MILQRMKQIILHCNDGSININYRSSKVKKEHYIWHSGINTTVVISNWKLNSGTFYSNRFNGELMFLLNKKGDKI